MRLEGIAGRVAVVTGSSSGIGLRVAETLRALGASVAGLDLGDAATGLDLALSADVRDEAKATATPAVATNPARIRIIIVYLLCAPLCSLCLCGVLSIETETTETQRTQRGTEKCYKIRLRIPSFSTETLKLISSPTFHPPSRRYVSNCAS